MKKKKRERSEKKVETNNKEREREREGKSLTIPKLIWTASDPPGKWRVTMRGQIVHEIPSAIPQIAFDSKKK